MITLHRVWAFAFIWTLASPAAAQQLNLNRVTVISDAFGPPSELERDWGYSVLVEYNGQRILFDTGNDSEHFAKNARLLGVDLTRLDAVVISHRHNDHTDGLRHVLAINPGVKIFKPGDEYFGGPTPQAFFRRSVPELPPSQRYFGGRVPAVVPHGTPWDGAVFIAGNGVEIAPGIRLVENVSPHAPFNETPELSLIIETPEGLVVLVGCSHPGIERILASASAGERPVHMVVGGLHLLTAPDAEVERIAAALKTEWGVQHVAPGHCSGEYAFHLLRRTFGSSYREAGVGLRIALP